jgi:REP element-mobilizing transposase RayT
MDNHFHLIVKTGKDPKKLSKFMQKVLTSFAMQINRKHQRVGHAFQGRYNANLLRYKKDLVRATNYIRKNPVEEGLVKKPSEYPWTKS